MLMMWPVALSAWDIALPLAVLVAAIALGLWLRNWIVRTYLTSDSGEVSDVWDLSKLEEMRQQGQLSDREFREIRRAVLGIPASEHDGLRETGSSEGLSPVDSEEDRTDEAHEDEEQ